MCFSCSQFNPLLNFLRSDFECNYAEIWCVVLLAPCRPRKHSLDGFDALRSHSVSGQRCAWETAGILSLCPVQQLSRQWAKPKVGVLAARRRLFYVSRSSVSWWSSFPLFTLTVQLDSPVGLVPPKHFFFCLSVIRQWDLVFVWHHFSSVICGSGKPL